MNLTVYGIPNCDTVKKARKLLEAKNIKYDFVDFKKTKPSAAWLLRWKKFVGEVPVNKRGTTYRRIKDDFIAANSKDKIQILQANPSAIKRPILELDSKVLAVGYDEDIWNEQFI